MFCGNCGMPVEHGRFCPHCGAPISVTQNESVASSGTVKKRKGYAKLFAGIAVAVVVLVAILVMPHTVDERCDWCGRRPSMAFKTSDGSTAYVCKDCSKECAVCGRRATKHYENLLGMIVFVCDDCYKEATYD